MYLTSFTFTMLSDELEELECLLYASFVEGDVEHGRRPLPKEVASILVFKYTIKRCGTDNCSLRTLNIHCIEHECKTSNCLNFAPSKSHLFSNFCNDCKSQMCSFVKDSSTQCYGKKIEGSDYCDAHKCFVFGCNNRVSFKEKKVFSCCVSHICMRDGCRKVASRHMLCSDHHCKKKHCLGEKPDFRDFCFKHTCGVLGCVTEVEEEGSYCRKHTCSFEGCKKRGRPYCGDHICASGCCREMACEDSEFCKTHLCAFEDCMSEAKGTRSFCIKHTCERKYCEEGRLEGKSDCGNHICKKCARKEYIIGTRLCIIHTCSSREREHCLNEVDDDRRFCDRHQCSYKSGCLNQRKSVFSSFVNFMSASFAVNPLSKEQKHVPNTFFKYLSFRQIFIPKQILFPITHLFRL